MATNCDYCHKPLSLMRRLRGEQFCSVEHLDQYSAQQAEFALERLASSVTEKPNTERPPTLTKSTPKLRPVAIPAAQPVLHTAQEAPAQPAGYPAVAVQEREVHAGIASAAAPQTPEMDYPMAPYLEQAAIEPREFEAVEDHLAGFSLADTWGKVSPAWSMPAFRSEPSDPRTWKAGKLAAGIPPAAWWRELLDLKGPEPMDLVNDMDAELPRLGVGVGMVGLELEEVCTGTDMQDAFPACLTQYRPVLALHPGTIEILIQAEYAAEYKTPQPVFTGMGESVRGAFRLAGNRLGRAARVRSELRSQASSFTFDEASGPQFTPGTPSQGTVVLAGAAISILPFATSQRPALGLAARALDSGTPEGPTAPEASCSLPLPADRVWTQSFAIPHVAMPEVLPRQILQQIAATESVWEELTGTVQNPAAQWFAPHFGYNGPSFGWESAPTKAWVDATSAMPFPGGSTVAAESAHFAEVDSFSASPRIKDFRARVNAGLESRGERLREGWSTPRTDAVKFEVGPLVSLRPTLTALDIQVRPLLPYKPARLEPASSPTFQLSLRPGQPPAAALLAPAMDAAVAGPSIAQPLPIRGPAPILGRYGSASPVALADTEMSGSIAQAGPLRYSPVALVVMPPSQFALLPPVLPDEQRYVAQVPNGVWRLPRVRQTGYRALGPFPKLPLRMPDRYLQTCAPVMHPALQEVPRTRVEKRQDVSGIPVWAKPVATRIHPADYWAWPEPKGMRSLRILPERKHQQAGGSLPEDATTTKRFGPGRAGLQGGNRNADGLAKGRGLR